MIENLNSIVCDNAEHYLEQLPDNSIDLIITSPPYDNLRDYNGYTWNFEKIANESYRVLKSGGVLVWIIGDKYTKGSKGLTSKKQCIYFVDRVGFRLHDEIIYQKDSTPFPSSNRYWQVWENCLVLSKGLPKSINLQKQKSKEEYRENNKCRVTATSRNKDGSLSIFKYEMGKEYRTMNNVWYIPTGYMKSSKDKISYQHPATFPEQLVERHILSWSNENDIVLDYFMGSGTTAKMALLNNRQFIGCDISQEYVNLANERLELYK